MLMKNVRRTGLALTATIVVVSILAAIAQTPNRRENDRVQPAPQDFVVGPGGPGPGAPRRMGGPMGQETKLVDASIRIPMAGSRLKSAKRRGSSWNKSALKGGADRGSSGRQAGEVVLATKLRLRPGKRFHHRR